MESKSLLIYAHAILNYNAVLMSSGTAMLCSSLILKTLKSNNILDLYILNFRVFIINPLAPLIYTESPAFPSMNWEVNDITKIVQNSSNTKSVFFNLEIRNYFIPYINEYITFN